MLASIVSVDTTPPELWMEKIMEKSKDLDAAIETKKIRLVEKADRYFSDGSQFLYAKEPESLTNVDVRKALDSAYSVIETLSVWLAVNNAEVE